MDGSAGQIAGTPEADAPLRNKIGFCWHGSGGNATEHGIPAWPPNLRRLGGDSGLTSPPSEQESHCQQEGEPVSFGSSGYPAKITARSNN
jgi:hypothetical protein